MDWGKCVFCQEDDIDLLDSLKNKNSDVDGYSKLPPSIESFLNKNVPRPAKCTTSTSLIDSKGTVILLLIFAMLRSISKLKRALFHKEKESDISL